MVVMIGQCLRRTVVLVIGMYLASLRPPYRQPRLAHCPEPPGPPSWPRIALLWSTLLGSARRPGCLRLHPKKASTLQGRSMTPFMASYRVHRESNTATASHHRGLSSSVALSASWVWAKWMVRRATSPDLYNFNNPLTTSLAMFSSTKLVNCTARLRIVQDSLYPGIIRFFLSGSRQGHFLGLPYQSPCPCQAPLSSTTPQPLPTMGGSSKSKSKSKSSDKRNDYQSDEMLSSFFSTAAVSPGTVAARSGQPKPADNASSPSCYRGSDASRCPAAGTSWCTCSKK